MILVTVKCERCQKEYSSTVRGYPSRNPKAQPFQYAMAVAVGHEAEYMAQTMCRCADELESAIRVAPIPQNTV